MYNHHEVLRQIGSSKERRKEISKMIFLNYNLIFYCFWRLYNNLKRIIINIAFRVTAQKLLNKP